MRHAEAAHQQLDPAGGQLLQGGQLGASSLFCPAVSCSMLVSPCIWRLIRPTLGQPPAHICQLLASLLSCSVCFNGGSFGSCRLALCILLRYLLAQGQQVLTPPDVVNGCPAGVYVHECR